MSITPNLINYLSNLTQTSTQTSPATTRPVPNIHQNDRIQIARQHDTPTARPVPTIPEDYNIIRSSQITRAVDEENQNQNSAKSNTCNPFCGLAIVSIIELCIALPMANCKSQDEKIAAKVLLITGLVGLVFSLFKITKANYTNRQQIQEILVTMPRIPMANVIAMQELNQNNLSEA
tara:strand:- start:11258 stop:11788 length:531 start_codon:yes stop_codon:yes gene_type:complete